MLTRVPSPSLVQGDASAVDDGATTTSRERGAGKACSAGQLSYWQNLNRWLEMRDFTEKDCELVLRTYESANVPRLKALE